MFFGSKFRTMFQKPKKLKNLAQQERIPVILGRPCGMRDLLGREKERGQKPQDIGDIGRSLEKAEIGKNLTYVSSTLVPGGAADSIETPWGGPPPPPHLCPGHCDRIGLRDWTPGFAFRKYLASFSIFSIFGIFVIFSIFGIIDFWRDPWTDYFEETLQKIAKISKKSRLGP